MSNSQSSYVNAEYMLDWMSYQAFLWFNDVHVDVAFRRATAEALVREVSDRRPRTADVAKEGLILPGKYL